MMSPPTKVAFFLCFSPNLFPMKAPKKLSEKVQIPILGIAKNIFVLTIAKVTPIASASMLVAIARTSIFESDKSFGHSSSSISSL